MMLESSTANPCSTVDDWDSLKSKVNDLACDMPSMVSWHNLFCIPQNQFIENAVISNLKKFVAFVDEKEVTVLNKILITMGVLCFLQHKYSGWTQWLSKPGFVQVISNWIVDDSSTKRQALSYFKAFLVLNKQDILRPNEDRFAYLFGHVTNDNRQETLDNLQNNVDALIKALNEPGFLEEIWNLNPYS